MSLPRVPAGKTIAAISLAGAVIGCSLEFLPRAFALRLIDSHGFFEDVCLAGYLGGVIILGRVAFRRRRTAALEGALALILMIAAELDFTGILGRAEERPEILVEPGLPVGERALAFFFLALALVLAVRLLAVRRRGFLAAFRRREPGAWLISAGLALMVAGVVFSMTQSFFPWQAGYRDYKEPLFGLSVAEEMAELCVPYCFLFAAWELRKSWYNGGRAFDRLRAKSEP
jgi:hypothetical protein